MKPDTTVVTNVALLSRKSRIMTEADITSGYAASLVEELKAKADAIRDNGRSNMNVVGMSAVQLDKPEALCIIKNRFGKWLILINPLITYKSEDQTRLNYEKCLSFPNKPFEVRRYDKIKVRYLTIRGTLCERTFAGKVGRRVQHEIDHINGVVPTKKQFERGRHFVESKKI